MERDRQGEDPRFNQTGENVTPPPLDVYQFIWDRTRMIRKDFILQNYSSVNQTMLGLICRTCSAYGANFCRRFSSVFAERVRGSVDL